MILGIFFFYKYFLTFETQVLQSFSYNSGNNDHSETVESLRDLVKTHVDPAFKV